MIVYFPQPSIGASVEWLHRDHLLPTARSAITVLTILHEEHEHAADFEDHPSVVLWRGHEVFLAHYGLVLMDRLNDEVGLTRSSIELQDQLSHELDLATTADYQMENPPWVGNSAMHGSFVSYLVTLYPDLYPELVGKVSWGIRLYLPSY